MAQKPTNEQIAAAVVASGATAEQAATSAESISALLATSPQGNDFLVEFNNKIQQVWNDTHSAATIYDRFKRYTNAPTVQAVVYEKIAPINFDFKTDISKLDEDERCFTLKVPKIHSVLKSVNLKLRYKYTGNQFELGLIQDGQAVSLADLAANLGASYADEATEKFIQVVDGLAPAAAGDETNAMSTLAEVSKFIQSIKYYSFKFKEKRSTQFNAYSDPEDSTAKAWTKTYPDMRPVVFIDPKKLYQIEGDYYATLFQIQQALPDVDFVEIDGLTGNKFAILADPRVIAWFNLEMTFYSEKRCGMPEYDRNYYLKIQEILGEFTCFNRMRFLTSAPASKARAK